MGGMDFNSVGGDPEIADDAHTAIGTTSDAAVAQMQADASFSVTVSL